MLVKESVMQPVDNMGAYNALNACFTLHQLNPSHWAELNDDEWPVANPEHDVPDWRSASPVLPSVKDLVAPGK